MTRSSGLTRRGTDLRKLSVSPRASFLAPRHRGITECKSSCPELVKRTADCGLRQLELMSSYQTRVTRAPMTASASITRPVLSSKKVVFRTDPLALL
jgi:hypothetical protein